MIRLHITSVMRKSSAEVNTVHYTYKDDTRIPTKTSGAEWEEIEFATEYEEKPSVQVANVAGSVVLIGQAKLIINDPKLFGTYKVGDIIEFVPTRIAEEAEAKRLAAN